MTINRMRAGKVGAGLMALLLCGCAQTQSPEPADSTTRAPGATPLVSSSTKATSEAALAAGISVLGNVGAALGDVVLATAQSSEWFVVAYPTGVVVTNRSTHTTRKFETLFAPLDLDDTGVLVAATEGGAALLNLEDATATIQVLPLGQLPSGIVVDKGRALLWAEQAVWTLDVKTGGDRSGEAYLGANAPVVLGAAGAFVVVRLPSAKVEVRRAKDGDVKWAAPLPEGFVAAGGAPSTDGALALIHGTTTAGPAVVHLTASTSNLHALDVPIRAVAHLGQSALLLDRNGRLMTSTALDEPFVLFDPGEIIAPIATLSTSGDAVLLTHQQTLTRIDATTWREPVAVGHRDRVTGLSFNADGSRLLSVALDGTLKVWDVAARTLARSQRLQAEFGGVWGVASVADDAVVLSSNDRITRVNTTTGAVVYSVVLDATSKGATTSIAVTPKVILAASPRTVTVLDVFTGALSKTISDVRLPRHSVTGGMLLPFRDGFVVAKGAQCPSGGVVTIENGECVPLSPRLVKGRRIRTEGDVLIAYDPVTVVFDGKTSRRIDLPRGEFDEVFLTDEGQSAVLVGRSSATKVSLAGNAFGTRLWTIAFPAFGRLRAAAVSPTGEHIALAGVKKGLNRTQSAAVRATITLIDVDAIRAIAASPCASDCEKLATAP